MANACADYEFTLKYSNSEQIQKIIGLHGNLFKKYSFQLEEGDGGYKHFQGRLSLIKKRRAGELVKLLKDYDFLEGIHITPTSNNGRADVNFYCLKDDTRIEGPWTDNDEKVFIPRQIREISELRKWQEDVINISKIWDTRTINIIVDPDGNNGKSTLVTWMRCYQLGRKIPFCNDYKDIMRMVCDMPISQCYLIDIPRAINKDKLFQMFGAIEEVKSGYAYDDRYKFKEVIFDCPNIFVFMNVYPDESLLSKDRWKLWKITSDGLRPTESPNVNSIY